MQKTNEGKAIRARSRVYFATETSAPDAVLFVTYPARPYTAPRARRARRHPRHCRHRRRRPRQYHYE